MPRIIQTYVGHAFCRRHALSHQQLEHSERQQHRDAKGNLLPRVSRQVETQWGQKRNEEAGQEQVEDVERGAALQEQGVGNFGVRVRAAAIHHNVSNCGHAVALPLHILHKVRQVSAVHGQTDVHLCRGHTDSESCRYNTDANVIVSCGFTN